MTQIVLDDLGYDDFDLGIWFCSDAMIRSYNRDYRDKDKATDILSFPYHAELRAGERITVSSDEDKNIGDILIAPNYVRHDLEHWDQDFDERLKVLLVHGICHLLGYDHILDEDYAVMSKEEKRILKLLKSI